MTNIIIRRDRARAKASVFLKGYPATPTWSSRYRGPVWKAGSYSGSFVNLRTDYPSAPDSFLPDYGYGGFSRAKISQNGPVLILDTAYDVACWGDSAEQGCLPDVDIVGYTHIDLDTIFSVTDGDGKIDLSGYMPDPALTSKLKFVVYNLTDGTVLTNSTFGKYSLYNNHVYRIRVHTESEGTGDPTQLAAMDIRFENATIMVPGAPES